MQKSKNAVVAIVCRERRDEGPGYHWKKQTRRGNRKCSDMIDHEGDRRAAMPSSNNIIVFETYLGYYPVISQSREDVR